MKTYVEINLLGIRLADGINTGSGYLGKNTQENRQDSWNNKSLFKL